MASTSTVFDSMKLKIIMLNIMDKRQETKVKVVSLHPELINVGFADGQNWVDLSMKR